MKKKKKAKGIKKDPNSVFFRSLHKGSDIRNNLPRAKLSVKYKCYPKLIKKMLANSLYKQAIVTNEFPRTLDDYNHKRFSANFDGEAELVWTASILSNYVEKINKFSEIRDEYEESLLVSNIDNTESILNSVEDQFGVSIWSISARFNVLQKKKGLAEQKDYLNRILSVDNIQKKEAILCWYLSYKCEESVTLSSLSSELKDILEIGTLNDYFRMHVIPYDIGDIEDIFAPLIMEENNTIIDRYQAFLFVVGIYLSRSHGEISDAIGLSLSLLEGVNDKSFIHLKNKINKYIPVLSSTSQFNMYDSYTQGNYEDSRDIDLTAIELSARSRLLLGEVENYVPKNLAEEISLLMSRILSVSDDYIESKSKLKKTFLSISSTKFAFQLSSFLHRDFGWINQDWSDDLRRLEYIFSDGLNPKHVVEMGEIIGFDSMGWIKNNSEYSPTFKLQYAINSDFDTGYELINNLNMPCYRKNLYLGHLAYKTNNLPLAVEMYREACKSDNNYLIIRANRYLYNTYWTIDNLNGCLDLVVSQCLSNESLVSVYPIEKLANRLKDRDEYLSDIRFSILLSFCSRFITQKWDDLLSDVYENVLFELSVDKPTELIESNETTNINEMIYFFRHIAVVRVMDDSIEFDTQEDVEKERILICQHLINIDNRNESIYSDEIRSLIYNIEIIALYDLVRTSKIYVNEDGIKSSVDSILKVFYSRFLSLLTAPEISYKAEDTANKLKELMKNNKDILMGEIKVPESEKKSLFAHILSYFLDQFSFNVAYGLDTNISTTIRHGEFEGSVKKAFELKSILPGSEADFSNEFLNTYFSNCTNETKEEIFSYMKKFGKKVRELIVVYINNYIQVKTDKINDGYFNFYSSQEQRDEFMARFNSSISYDDFFRLLINYAWVLVDRSMEKLQKKLDTDFRSEINALVDRLLYSIKRNSNEIGHERYISPIVQAKEEFNSELDNIISWFKRPTDIDDNPCSISLVVDVALKQTNNCYVKHEIYIEEKNILQSDIKGCAFKSIVGILYILFQNVVLHSNSSDKVIPVNLKITESGNDLIFNLSHEMYGDYDVDELRETISSAVEKYERDNALRMARAEGGSGLSKIWRISHFDLKSESQLDMEIGSDGRVNITLSLLKDSILL